MSIAGEQWTAACRCSSWTERSLHRDLHVSAVTWYTHARRWLGRSERGSLQFHGRWLDLLITRISFWYPVDVLPSPVDTPASGPGQPDYRGVYGIRLVRPAGANCHADVTALTAAVGLLFSRKKKTTEVFIFLTKKINCEYSLFHFWAIGYLEVPNEQWLISRALATKHVHTGCRFSPREHNDGVCLCKPSGRHLSWDWTIHSTKRQPRGL